MQALLCHMDDIRPRAETTPTDVAPGCRAQKNAAIYFSVYVCPYVIPYRFDCVRIIQWYWRLFVRTSKPIPPKIDSDCGRGPIKAFNVLEIID